MNLVTDPWIPILKLDGKHDLASLQQVFSEGKEYADLAVRPHERIALMRLLICIAHAGLDGPANIDDWDEAPKKLPEVAANYLTNWQQLFDLFDLERPFLQIAKLEKPSKKKKTAHDESSSLNPVSKLDFALASQNNSTLFDHEANSLTPRLFPPEWIAHNLLTFQNFSSSGRIGVALWNGIESQGGGSSPSALCLKNLMLHTFVRKGTLLDSVCANLMTKKQIASYLYPCQWGKPLWEKFPKSPDDADAVFNMTETYLGRLVPLSRWIKIDSHGGDMILANGFGYPTYPDFPAECTATERIMPGKNERRLLKIDDKRIWRKLHAILVRYTRERGGRSPLCLDNQTGNDAYDIWVGGISWSSDGGYLDTTESVYKIVPELQTDVGVATYEKEVLYADRTGGQLTNAVREYRKHIDGELGKIDRENNAERKRELSRKLEAIAIATAVRSYWTAVEKLLPLLWAHVESIGTTAEAVRMTSTAWRRAVHGAARDSYRLACGQGTPRQMRAFALGWERLFAAPGSQDSKAKSETIEVTQE
jgi:CRISPR system Cascade subunit CasA